MEENVDVALNRLWANTGENGGKAGRAVRSNAWRWSEADDTARGVRTQQDPACPALTQVA